MAAPANRYTHELNYGAADRHHHTCIPEVSSPWTTQRGLPSVVLIAAPAAVQHPRAAAAVLRRCVRAELSQPCCLSCQTGRCTTASEILVGALAMANLSSHTSRLPVPPFSCSHPSIGKLLSRAVPGSAAPSHHARLSEEPHFHPKTRRFRVHMTPSPHLLLPPEPSSDHEWAQPSVSQRLMACAVGLFSQPV